MYAEFFGLQREPFSIAPDPRFLYMSERHREALAHLLYGIRGGGGFVVLTGEIGAGKTTVCRCFLEQVPPNCNVAYIFNPKLSSLELLQSLCQEFHIPEPEPLAGQGATTLKQWVDALNAFLLESHAAGKNSIVIVDEAQNLDVEVLEQLRLLTNLETAEHKLLQIILIGQPELRELLERPELEQLSQRVIARYHLKALTPDELSAYVRHRMDVGGLRGEIPFRPETLARLHELSRGIPRRVNLLCDRALLGAYGAGRREIDLPMLEQAAVEVFGTRAPHERRSVRRLRQQRRQLLAAIGVGVLAGVTLLAGALWVHWRKPFLPGTPAPTAASAAARAASVPQGVGPGAVAGAGAVGAVPVPRAASAGPASSVSAQAFSVPGAASLAAPAPAAAGPASATSGASAGSGGLTAPGAPSAAAPTPTPQSRAGAVVADSMRAALLQSVSQPGGGGEGAARAAGTAPASGR